MTRHVVYIGSNVHIAVDILVSATSNNIASHRIHRYTKTTDIDQYT